MKPHRTGQRYLQRPAVVWVVLLHLGLFWLATRPLPHAGMRDDRVWVQLLSAQPKLPFSQKRAAVPITRPQPDAAPPSTRAPAAPAASTAATMPEPALAKDQPEQRALPADPLASDPMASAANTLPANVAQQALKAAGAIDRQLRAEHPQQFTAPPDTPQARLVKGLAAAHAAVGPKWFEAASTELISAPNDPKRIYRIKTAIGEYCVYYPDKGSISANSDPKSGWAGFGQPKIAGCPVAF